MQLKLQEILFQKILMEIQQLLILMKMVLEQLISIRKLDLKITDDGLKEITQKKLTISGATAITIKRGDTLDLLAGVSVNVNDQIMMIIN